MASTLAQTPLHDWHAAHGGRMVDFAGWSMPVQYGSIVAEHNATRQAASLFDVSHMGRLAIMGAQAGAFLEGLVTRRIADMAPRQIRYALVTNDAGGTLDDVLVYQHAGFAGGEHYLMVVNASNRQKILDWITPRMAGFDVHLSDGTHETSMIALQGPKAQEILAPLCTANLAELKYYHSTQARIGQDDVLVSRTGYTGEDGFELIVPANAAVEVWQRLLKRGAASGIMAAGLGARDTLRLEAGMPLYGHELSEEMTPLDAGLDFAVDLQGRSFPGRDAVAQRKLLPPLQRVGLEISGKRVPREKYPVLAEGEKIGEVTSGTFSPTLQKPIAMAYVPPRLAVVGTELAVDIRGAAAPAKVVKLPFYRRRRSS